MFTYPLNSSASPVITTYGTGETNNMTLAPYEPGTEIVIGLVDAFGALAISIPETTLTRLDSQGPAEAGRPPTKLRVPSFERVL